MDYIKCLRVQHGNDNVEALQRMVLGEPGKPPVRFDEGRNESVIDFGLSSRPFRLLY